jgi:hypothetical protein
MFESWAEAARHAMDCWGEEFKSESVEQGISVEQRVNDFVDETVDELCDDCIAELCADWRNEQGETLGEMGEASAKAYMSDKVWGVDEDEYLPGDGSDAQKLSAAAIELHELAQHWGHYDSGWSLGELGAARERAMDIISSAEIAAFMERADEYRKAAKP